MLKQLILINSANCDFAQIDVDRDLFFGGSNGTGKTTTIRALQYLFVTEQNALGIDSSKKSFREYYLPESNSYIIYVFESFFILLYRTQSGIGKYFSKQKFDISRIENSDIKDIRKYIKEADLHYKSDTIDEFRQILYGQSRKYLDFSIANVKEYKTFIKLFSGVFDIQRAITSTDDIKMAIYKSIDSASEDVDFNSNAYLQEILAFKSAFRYFKAINSNRKRIESSIELKSEILHLENYLKTLKGEIAYRSEFESNSIKNLKESKSSLENSIKEIESRDRKLKRVKEKFFKFLNNLTIETTVEIREIEKLKEKFSNEKIKDAKIRVIKLDRLNSEVENRREQIFEIEQEHKNLIISIEREIENLKNSLKKIELENRENLQNERESLKESFEKRKSHLNRELSEFKVKQELEREKFDLEIDILNDEINSLKDSIREIDIDFDKKLSKEREKLNLEVQSVNDRIYSLKNQIKDREFSKKSFDKEIIEFEKDYKREYKDALNEFNLEVAKIKKEKRNLESLLEVKEGSFREFLDKNIDGWEESLYPVIDKNLLAMSVDKLEPEILREDEIFGIKLNLDILEKIPTKAKVLEDLKALEFRELELEKNFKNREALLVETKELKISKINSELKYIAEDTLRFNKKIIELKEKKTSFEKSIDEIKSKIERERSEAKEEFNRNLAKLNSDKDEVSKSKREINSKINIKTGEISRAKSDINRELQKEIENLEKNFKKLYRDEKSKVDEKVAKLIESKNSITADDKLKELKIEEKRLIEEIKEANLAQRFLVEFDEVKERIESIDTFIEREKKYNLTKERFEQKYNSKFDNFKKESENLKLQIHNIEREVEKFEDGLNRLKSLHIGLSENQKLKSERNLLELIREFEDKQNDYSNSFDKFSSGIKKLNTNLTPFSQIDFVYRDEDLIFKDLTNSQNSIDFIDYLSNQLKSFAQYKESENERFYNFINNINLKLENLSHKEEDLIKVIQKVNRVLKGVDIDVLKEIYLKHELSPSKSFTKISHKIKEQLGTILTLERENSLFFDRKKADESLEDLYKLIESIRDRLSEDEDLKFAGVDLWLSFVENSVKNRPIKHFKNVGSNGTSILLKIIIITALLSIYKQEEIDRQAFYLIIDEIGAIEKKNQDAIRDFANSHGFKTIFSTTNPILSKPKDIRYYRFARNGQKFEVIGLNRVE